MLLSQALASVASVGVTCGAGCGSAAFGFLSSYILSRGKGWSGALRQTLSFFLGKLLAVMLACACSSLLGTALIGAENSLLHKAVYLVMLLSALWLLYGWYKEKKSCKSCRHCAHTAPAAPSFAVGFAYGLSPCAPLLMVLGYSALLSLPGALALGAVFALASSLVPIILTLTVAGALSVQITKQLGLWMPRFRLAVYLLFLVSALAGLFS